MLMVTGATNAGASSSRPTGAATAAGAGAAASNGSVGPAGYPGAYGTLPGPGTGTPEQGVGTVSIGEQPGAGPDWILPIVPAANASVFDIYQFIDYMWRPLWWSPVGPDPEIDYSQSIATQPVLSDDDKTVVIKLRPGWKWSDGQPVTAKDVEFFVDLVVAAVKINPTDYDNYAPGLFPDFISSMSTPATDTLVLNLKSTFNPDFLDLDELTDLYALPSHAWAKTSAGGPIIDFTKPANAAAIYTFLAGQSRSLQTYATNPLWQVTDGPFGLHTFDPETGGNSFVPNPSYSGPVKPHIAELDDVPFTSDSAEVAALLAGTLTVGSIETTDLPQVGKITAAGYDVWGDADFAFSYSPYNFEDKTGDFDNIIEQLYIRQALAHLEDEQSLISSKGAYGGAAAPDYGPVAPVPQSPFTPPDARQDPYPPSIEEAASLLSSHGWNVVPHGRTTCVRAGVGSDECGAGIPVGTALAWNFYYANSPPVIGTQDEAFATAAEQVGIDITLESRTFNYIIANLSDASNPANVNLWAMQDFGGFSDYLDPTTYELLNTGGSYNIGGYSDPQADTDIDNSVHSLDPSAEEAEASYLTAQQPGLFQPNGDNTFAFSDTLHGPPASFADASQYQFSPEYWYFTAPHVVAAAPTPDGKGYLLVTSDGSVYPHGEARF
jgi:peptide/nickel transport system substrate-binding protein